MVSQRQSIPVEILKSAKDAEIKMTEHRITKRKERLMQCIVKSVSEYHPIYLKTFTFDLNNRELSVISNNITNELSNWNGGDGYKMVITNYKQGYGKVRTYWNRKKSIPLGNHLFSTIFHSLFKYIMTQFTCFERELKPKSRLLLFMNIFQNLLKENIKFPKSKNRPLIMYSCFLKQNQFKQFCVQFVELFACWDFKWDNQAKITKTVQDENGQTRSQYVRNDNRVKQLHDGFVDVLNNINMKLESVEFIPKSVKSAIESFIKSKDQNNNYSCVVVGDATVSMNLDGSGESSFHRDNELLPFSIDCPIVEPDCLSIMDGYQSYGGFHVGSIGNTEWCRYSPMQQYNNNHFSF